MTTLVLGPNTFVRATRRAKRHILGGRTALGIAHTVLGKFLDSCCGYVLGILNAKFERDISVLRGLVSRVRESDVELSDRRGEGVRLLIELEASVRKLRMLATQKTQVEGNTLMKAQGAMAKLREVLGVLEAVAIELKLAIAERDMVASMAVVNAGTLVYELTEHQAEQLEEWKTADIQPTATMKKAARRYAAQVTSR